MGVSSTANSIQKSGAFRFSTHKTKQWCLGECLCEVTFRRDYTPKANRDSSIYCGQSRARALRGSHLFKTGKNSKVTISVDGKVAVTSDLILDFTINPDFGQVQADPSQVRIDGFQNLFQERRPFFIES